MDRELQAAYLARLGLEAEPPSVDALQRLHRAQVERVPYETIWIHAGEGWTVDVEASVQRIALEGRGGYCFHLNGAFSALLESLGYSVSRHVGGVHGPDGPEGFEMTNHLVLSVNGLPTADHPDGVWYVDAGLGDALYEAVPLRAARFEQAPFQLSIEATPDGVGDWHLTHGRHGGFAGMAWRAETTPMDAFAERHEWLSMSPDSPFVRVVTAQRRDAEGVDIIRGCVLTRVQDGDAIGVDLTERADWFDALADVFGLPLDHLAPEARDALWERTATGHQQWVEAGRP